jgi:hypothetical protein
MFQSLFFDGALRPVRGWPREDEHAPRPRCEDTVRVLRKEDILEVVKTLLNCATARATSTTSTTSATAVCVRSAS